MIELVLGGARSGKSSYAEQQAVASGLSLAYLATATVGDGEMSDRIRLHQQQRQQHPWMTIEEPIRLAQILVEQAQDGRCILVDCLTLWLTNCLCHENKDLWAAEKQALLDCLPGLRGHVIFVSNEVGQGIVPLGELNRRFVDESGWLHQALAIQADKVTFVTAGIAQSLKG